MASVDLTRKPLPTSNGNVWISMSNIFQNWHRDIVSLCTQTIEVPASRKWVSNPTSPYHKMCSTVPSSPSCSGLLGGVHHLCRSGRLAWISGMATVPVSFSITWDYCTVMLVTLDPSTAFNGDTLGLITWTHRPTTLAKALIN